MYELREALSEGVVLELNETYREAVIAESKVRQTEESLAIARNWVRNEQLNYDLGFGDMDELVDAVRQELELRVELKQSVFELNKKMAALDRKSTRLNSSHVAISYAGFCLKKQIRRHT